MSSLPRRGVAEGRKSPRLFEVVRVLLCRPFLATVGALLFTAANGCVVPIGPDFHDKPPPEKIPPIRPIFVAAGPEAFLRTVTLDTDNPTRFTVKAEDPNVEDSISVRFSLNYPPFTLTTKSYGYDTKGPSERMQPFYLDLTCDDVKPFPAADRRLTVIASDNGFYKSPDTLQDSSNRLNYDADGEYLPTMSGWSLTGCP